MSKPKNDGVYEQVVSERNKVKPPYLSDRIEVAKPNKRRLQKWTISQK